MPVPPLVDRAGSSGVVPGEPGGAAVLGASSGFAEGAHHRFGAGGAASAIASQHNHAWIVPPPKQGKLFSASPYPSPVGLAVVASGRVTPAGSSSRVVLVAVVGLGWLGVARRAQPHRAETPWFLWRHGRLPGQPRSAGRSRGAGAPQARAQRGRRSRPGTTPGRGELFARVGGSSVSLTCSCADQGGFHVDMVVGADHRGRCCVAVWRDAGPSSPLTARRPSPITAGAPARPGRRRGVAGVSRAPRAQPTTQRRPARRDRVCSRGWASGARAWDHTDATPRQRRQARCRLLPLALAGMGVTRSTLGTDARRGADGWTRSSRMQAGRPAGAGCGC
jgi:hypothetical protein